MGWEERRKDTWLIPVFLVASVATHSDETTRGRRVSKKRYFAPLRFEVLMREPSEDVTPAFGEGQMTCSGGVKPDRLVQRLSPLQCFLPLGTETRLQVAFKIRNRLSSYVERSGISCLSLRILLCL